MTVTQTLRALGAWSVNLVDETPDEILDQLGWFGHIVILDSVIDPVPYGDTLLASARYVGVMRARTKDRRGLAGEGMIYYLADEDGKGDVIENELAITSATVSAAVTAVLPPSLTIGTVYPLGNPAARYTGKHRLQSRRDALDAICDAFGVEYRVNGDATVDVGTQAQLYGAVPDSIIVRKASGTDMDLVAVDGTPEVSEQVRDYTNRVVVVGETTDAGQFATGSADAATVPYFDIRGNVLKSTRLISQATEDDITAPAAAQLKLNEYNRVIRTLRLATEEYASEGSIRVGDMALVYDPESGITDPNREVEFDGERVWPDIIRVSGVTWPVTAGHTVAYRTGTGVWVDLTPYVTWETEGGELVVGDLPASLMRRTDDPLALRIDAAKPILDTTIPNAPTGLTLNTDTAMDTRGNDVATIGASWTAPTTNTDSSVPVDLAYYTIRWRITGRTEWQQTTSVSTSTDLPAVIDSAYEVQVAAVDRAGNMSAWSGTATITTLDDVTPPNAPADPIVTAGFKQVRIEYIGLAAGGGAMPADTNRVDVEVGTSGTGPWTVVSSVTPFARQVAYADVPFGITRWVRLRAYDHAGNVSAASAVVTGTSQLILGPDVFAGAIGSAALADLAVINAKIALLAVNDANIGALNVSKLTAGNMTADVIMAGRFATALTGARREVNSVGFQAWDASNVLTISLDGTSNLLTGQVRTALSGERLILNPGGTQPSRLDFYPSSGSQFATIEAETVASEAAVTISANNAVHTANSGVLLIRRNFAHMFFGRPDLGSIATEIYTDPGTARMTAGIVDVIVDTAKGSPGGDRFSMVAKNGAGKIASTQLNYWETPGNQPWLAAVNQDAGIFFASGAAHIVGNDPFVRRDLNIQTLFYTGALTPVSSRRVKDDIQLVTGIDMKVAARAAKARSYRMPHKNEPARTGDPRFGDTPARTAPLQIGLIAEELPPELQVVVPDAIGDGTDVLSYDQSGMIAVMWTDHGDIWAAIERLEAALPPGKVGDK